MRREIGLRGRMVGIAISTSVLTVLVIQSLAMGFVTYAYLFDEALPQEIGAGLQEAAREGASALAQRDRESVRSLIDRNANLIAPPVAPVGTDSTDNLPMSAAVVDSENRVFAASADWRQFERLTFGDLPIPAEERVILDPAWKGEVVARRFNGRLIAAAPIRRDQQVIGVALIRSPEVFRTDLVALGAAQRLGSALLVTGTVAALIGWLTGLALSRWIRRRLGELSHISAEWQRGNLSERASELPADEVGALAARLNEMAGGLGEVLELRREISALEERRRLTRDLHDTVKQQAFATHLLLSAAKDHLAGGHSEAAQQALANADDCCQAMQAELRTILDHLRAPIGQGLEEAFRATAERWSRMGDLDVILEIPVEAAEILPGHRQHLLMVVEEALANVVKHSRASECRITLLARHDQWRLTIRDDGIGMDTDTLTDRGIGLASLRERAALLGGEMSFRAPGEGGTVVELTFPRIKS